VGDKVKRRWRKIGLLGIVIAFVAISVAVFKGGNSERNSQRTLVFALVHHIFALLHYAYTVCSGVFIHDGHTGISIDGTTRILMLTVFRLSTH
jgi:hypothetical protein